MARLSAHPLLGHSNKVGHTEDEKNKRILFFIWRHSPFKTMFDQLWMMETGNISSISMWEADSNRINISETGLADFSPFFFFFRRPK